MHPPTPLALAAVVYTGVGCGAPAPAPVRTPAPLLWQVTQAEGMMVGPSAGAAIKYACDVACRPEAAGKTIVVIVPSHGIRYVQHPLWGKMKAEVRYTAVT